MKRLTIALALVVVILASGSVRSDTLPVALVDAKIEGNNGIGTAILSGSTATWQYDTVTGVVTGSGFYQAQYQISSDPLGQLFTHEIVDLIVGGGNAASATSYECIEGGFGSIAGGHLCGNINFGPNGVFDSSVSYGPGTAFSRTIVPDDFSEGPQQDLTRYDGWITTFDGSVVFLSRAFTPEFGGFEMTFQVIPVPAAVWLFGSALGLLGWMKRQKQN